MGRGDPISAGNLDGVGSHICRKPRLGENPIPTGSQMWDPISAGSIDGGGSRICRKPRCGENPISAGNLDGDGIPYLQET